MVKVERTPTSPPSLAEEAVKAHGSYSKPDVILQLMQDFHCKCYICELVPSDLQVEHLLPHHNRKIKERVFDWNNLFPSCPHCNNLKKESKYDDQILDCCKTDPETLLDHIFGNGAVKIAAKKPSADLTAELITASFEKRNTGIREYQCQFRYEKLAEEMNTLFVTLERYKSQPDAPRNQRSLRGLLSRSSPFAAFKRYYVRLHLADYPGLEPYIA